MTATRQRFEGHRDLDAVADAIEVVPRSTVWDEGLDALRSLTAPTLVVGSRDDSDPGHPLAVAQAYADVIPQVELAVEEEGGAPLAWQGAQLSQTIAEFLARRVPQDASPAPS